MAKIPLEERRRRLLQDPVIYAKINDAANRLAKQFGSQAQILVDITLGATFKNVETGQRYTYDGIALPYPHNDIVGLIAEVANQPLDVLKDASYFIISEVLKGPGIEIIMPGEEKRLGPVKGQNLLIAGRDFIKYFAIGSWVLDEIPVKVDPDEFAQQKDVLKFTG